LGLEIALTPGVIQEWFSEQSGERDRARWIPPLSVVSLLACWAMKERAAAGAGRGAILWIGRACWPYPPALVVRGDGDQEDLLRRSIFIEAPGSTGGREGVEGMRIERVWAIDLAVRSSAVTCVVADGRDLGMAELRRLQLAAASGGALALLLRPVQEASRLSVAPLRWLVRAAGDDRAPKFQSPDASACSRWTVQLLRCKGMQPFSEDARCWTVQRDHATGDVRVVSDVSDRSSPAAHRRPARGI
jgi:hypothetical protein